MKKGLAVITICSFAILLAACKQQASEAPIPASIKHIMNQSRYSTAKWGFYVKDLTDNKILYRVNTNKMFIPASVSKLFTVSALLNTYGFDYTFRTPIYAVGRTDSKGVLNGNLVLVGKGDLTLGGRLTPDNKIAFTSFDHIYAGIDCYKGEILTPQDPLWGIKSLAKQVKASGIKAIHGNVLVDNRLFETIAPRGNTLSPVMVNENLVDMEVMPTQVGKSALLRWRPQVSQLQVVNHVLTSAPGEKPVINVTANACDSQIVVSGTVPADRQKVVAVSPIQNPQQFVQNALLDALHNEGISVIPNASITNTLPDLKSYTALKPVAVFISPPLNEYAKLIWKVSHNPGANLVPLLLSASQNKTTSADGMRMIGHFLTDKAHIPANEVSFSDGAGGDGNYVTCDAVIKLLDYLYHLPKAQFEKCLSALPVLGEDGSLASVAQQSPARGHVFAKTGTGIIQNQLQDNFFLTAQSLGGYIKAKNGHLLAFMVVVNGAPLKDICDVNQVSNDLGMIAAGVYGGV